MKFSKEKAFERFSALGKTPTDEQIKDMENMDGQTAQEPPIFSFIDDFPVLWVEGKNGQAYYVMKDLCI